MERALEGQPVEDFPEPAYVDGDAPEDGHAPFVPTPTKTKKPKPTPSETLTPTPPKSSHTPPGQHHRDADADRPATPAR